MAAALSVSFDHHKGYGLTPAIQAQLGQDLRDAYIRLPDAAAALPSSMSDVLEQLTAALAAFAERDERMFRTDFEALIPSLHRFAINLTKRQAQADDLVQETLLRAWRSRKSFTIGTNLGAWMFTIMRNTFYSSTRRHVLEVSPSEEDRGEGPAIVPDQLDHLDVQDVQRALQALKDPMRQALLLVAIEGLSYEQAAEIMNCQVGTVKSRVWRAREQLSQLLGYGAGEFGADHLTLSVVNG